MYKVFEDAIDIFSARVVIVENAPALFTNKGKAVADRLFEIVNERNYSLTLYKTSTKFHGIPQARDRTFAIAWDSEVAPIMSYYDRPRKSFTDYLLEIPSDTLHQDIIIRKDIMNEHYYQYIKHKTKRDPREVLREAGIITTLKYVDKHLDMKDAVQWFHEVGDEKGYKLASHAIDKFEQGLGVWDSSAHIFDDVMNAVIGRNMNDTMHPTEDRSLTVREALYLMGFPNDFELLGGKKNLNHVAQNVPACTARDICLEASKYLNGELDFCHTNYSRQSNYKKTLVSDDLATINREGLSAFY